MTKKVINRDIKLNKKNKTNRRIKLLILKLINTEANDLLIKLQSEKNLFLFFPVLFIYSLLDEKSIS